MNDFRSKGARYKLNIQDETEDLIIFNHSMNTSKGQLKKGYVLYS